VVSVVRVLSGCSGVVGVVKMVAPNEGMVISECEVGECKFTRVDVCE
jgi:hypothetical protein